ncbi:nucleoside hydrolase [Enterococcus sp. S86.2]|uniref:nucleoside hydrolase n=1 Tax=Enterococcus sp. S86.2 TaxID=3031299 RepID=UPI0026F2F4C3|nr:nucleoside hydrolase [Enterococcus sp. S86.2]
MKYILDIDTGIDDALALAYLISEVKKDILGITTVFGNTSLESATMNTVNILEMLDLRSIPVFKGSDCAIAEDHYIQKRGSKIFHGSNGVADISLGEIVRQDNTQSAAEFIINSARKYGDNLTVIATGPLTNISKALDIDSVAIEGIKELVIMGGALVVQGNVSRVAEANFFHDAHAAKKILDSNIPLLLVGLDVSLRTLLTRDDVSDWKFGTRNQQLFYHLVDYYISAHEFVNNEAAGCALHDPLAVAIALDNSRIYKVPLKLKVLLEEDQLGRIVMDCERMEFNKQRNCSVVLDLDVKYYESKISRQLTEVLSS